MTTANAPEIPNLPIMLSVVLAEITDMSPTVQTYAHAQTHTFTVSALPRTSILRHQSYSYTHSGMLIKPAVGRFGIERHAY